MVAYASCPFPLLNRWKDFSDKNRFLTFIDSILSGYSQIVLSDNSFTGLLFLAACFYGSAALAVSSLTAAATALLVAYFLGVPRISLRLGLYTFNPILAGIGVSVLIYPGQGISIALILTAMAAGVLCVGITAGLTAFLAPYGTVPFSLPFCIVLIFLIPASLRFSVFNPQVVLAPMFNGIVTETASWSAPEFLGAMLSGCAEALFQVDPVIGILVLAGILCSSRIDALAGIYAVFLATSTAALLGISKGWIMAGLQGYNALFIMLVLFGRAYAMSIKSFIVSSIAVVLTVFLTIGFTALFSPFGIPTATLPFALMSIFMMSSKSIFPALTPVEPIHWGVPETIAKMRMAQEPQAESLEEASI